MYHHWIGILPVAADLDGVVENGTYEARAPANGPSGGDWIVAVLKSPLSTPGDAEVIQVAFSKTDGSAYSRSANAGAWGDWAALSGAGGATLPTATKGEILVANDAGEWVALAAPTVDGQVLTASSAAATGMAWVSPV